MLRFVKEVSRTRVVPEEINHSMICLIPKQTHPESMTHFRPIYLSNVVIKIITKIITNHLKPLMKDLVGPNQASFIPEWDIRGNIVLTQELIHSYNRKKGKKETLIAKINLEKTYDRVDCGFLEKLMTEIGVGKQLRKVVTSCITTTNLSVLLEWRKVE